MHYSNRDTQMHITKFYIFHLFWDNMRRRNSFKSELLTGKICFRFTCPWWVNFTWPNLYHIWRNFEQPNSLNLHVFYPECNWNFKWKKIFTEFFLLNFLAYIDSIRKYSYTLKSHRSSVLKTEIDKIFK